MNRTKLLKKFTETQIPKYELSYIAKVVGCDIDSAHGNVLISDIKSLENADETSLTFFTNKKYVSEFRSCRAAVCIVPVNFNEYTN